MALLEISNRTLKFGHTVINLRNVTSVDIGHGKTPRPFTFKQIAWGIGIFLVAVLVLTEAESKGFPSLLALGSGAFVALAFVWNQKPRDFWVLIVETAAGTKSVIASRDRNTIIEAQTGVVAAIQSDVPVHTSINIADSTLISDSVITNSKIENVKTSKQ